MKKSMWFFLFTLIISTSITLSANNWISMWMGLELNMMSFIPIILSKNNKSSAEASMIYFLVQSISSMMLMFMVLMKMIKYMMPDNINNFIVIFSLLMKLGAAPFHMWMPEMLSKINWFKSMILLSWQKLAPLMMISNININNSVINISIMLSVVIGSLGGINQMSLRKMMAYSSINHLGWMLAINKNIHLWMIYFTVYSIMIMIMCQTFNKMKIYFINQMSSLNMNNTMKIMLFIMMMSMGGMPPFIGFLPKWIVIQSMMNSEEMFLIMMMIMFSLIPLMFYIRVMTNMFMLQNSTIKWFQNCNMKMNMFIIMSMNMSLPMIMIMDVL
uniref:NADH dehydrogenase subunit 2 n=1 Tax=Aelia sibirica TaxID=1331313 RepID=UPI00223768E3|nr:NADH dehydrogenase subunit 2 [Aelia sibirica]UYA97065.1 NADH dehydrogenase subunit 2 [Aelia sibirica]